MDDATQLPVREERAPWLKSFPVLTLSKIALQQNNIIGFDSRDLRARPFNLLRTSFAKRVKENDARLIGITSATPAAGKSFLSLNLAAALSRVAEKPVYLVDLDLRRASLAHDLGYEPEAGVIGFLNGSVESLPDIGVRIEDTRLAIFPTIHSEDNTSELLSGPRFTQMVDAMRDNPDGATVLFDLPPAFASDDAMISLEGLDGYILVADSGKTTKKQIREVLALLDPVPCMGTILNRYRGGFGDPYGYGYGGADYGRYYS